MKRLQKAKGWAAAALLLTLLVLSSSQSRAQNPGDFPPGGPEPHNQEAEWKSALNLTPEQMTRIRSIREGNRDERQAVGQRLGAARRALDQAIYADDVDEAEVERLARQLAEAQAAEVRLRAMTELSIRRVLTPEQLNTFRTIRMERMREAQMRRRLENGGQRRPGRRPRLENGLGGPPGRRPGALQRRDRP